MAPIARPERRQYLSDVVMPTASVLKEVIEEREPVSSPHWLPLVEVPPVFNSSRLMGTLRLRQGAKHSLYLVQTERGDTSY